MELLVLLAVAVAGGAAVAAVLLWIIWRAVGNAFDWVIETFGNDQAVRRLHEERRRRPSRTSGR